MENKEFKTIKELEAELKCKGPCMHALCGFRRVKIGSLKDVLKLIDEMKENGFILARKLKSRIEGK